MEFIRKYAKYYGLVGVICFLISVELNLLITIGILKRLPFETVSFFSVTGILIGAYLIILGDHYSVVARNHGIIVLVLNIIAFILCVLVLFASQLGLA